MRGASISGQEKPQPNLRSNERHLQSLPCHPSFILFFFSSPGRKRRWGATFLSEGEERPRRRRARQRVTLHLRNTNSSDGLSSPMGWGSEGRGSGGETEHEGRTGRRRMASQSVARPGRGYSFSSLSAISDSRSVPFVHSFAYKAAQSRCGPALPAHSQLVCKGEAHEIGKYRRSFCTG